MMKTIILCIDLSIFLSKLSLSLIEVSSDEVEQVWNKAIFIVSHDLY